MIVIRLLILSCIFMFPWSASSQSADLAKEYIKQGDFTKAELEYEALIKSTKSIDLVYNDYLSLLLKIRKYEKAQTVIQNHLKNNPAKVALLLDLENVQLLRSKNEEAKLTREKIVTMASQNDQYVYEVQNRYYTEGKFKELIDFLKTVEGKQTIPRKFGIQLARAYLYNGDKQNMLIELLHWGNVYGNVDYIRNNIADNFKTDSEIKILEKVLFDFIQEKPNEVFFNEMLIWFYTQQKEFKKAFRFSRALDKRLRLNGQNLLDLGLVAYNNKDYEDAQTIFSYITTEYATTQISSIATYWLIQAKEKIIKNTFPIKTEEIIALKNEYEAFRLVSSNSSVTIDIIRNLALLEAFYLNNRQRAIELLNDLLINPLSNAVVKDQCKIDLADIYLLNNEPWESSLLYMQVEKSQKDSPIAEQAKLKNALLFYYQSEFELAKEVLDILKKATTREIANDAIKLSLHIQENIGIDSIPTSLIAFSKAELLIFQNKLSDADIMLDSLFVNSLESAIADDILWLRSDIALKQGDYQQAVNLLEVIHRDYSFDTLADDALYLAANIELNYLNRPEKAISLYERIIFELPGSIFSVDARKKLRELRGDKL